MNAMRDDPQHRQLMQKHEGSVDVIRHHHDEHNDNTTTCNSQKHNVAEQRGHVRKALHAATQDMGSETSSLISQLDQIMMAMMIASMDVAEFYSPPRIIEMARAMGPRTGWSMDITTQDSDGRAWDFNAAETRNRAARRILMDKPLLLIGSPMCTIHSIMNNINNARMPREVVQQRFAYARGHLKFAAQLYKMQVQGGRYLPHGHPASASSWQGRCIKEVLKLDGVRRVLGDQCCYGLKTMGRYGERLARKTTACMTNSPCIALQLQRRCPNTRGYQEHGHVRLQGGRANAAQVYPLESCKAVCN